MRRNNWAIRDLSSMVGSDPSQLGLYRLGIFNRVIAVRKGGRVLLLAQFCDSLIMGGPPAPLTNSALAKRVSLQGKGQSFLVCP